MPVQPRNDPSDRARSLRRATLDVAEALGRSTHLVELGSATATGCRRIRGLARQERDKCVK